VAAWLEKEKEGNRGGQRSHISVGEIKQTAPLDLATRFEYSGEVKSHFLILIP
jgi:hypothetical protein